MGLAAVQVLVSLTASDRVAIGLQQHQHMGMACGTGSECQSPQEMVLVVEAAGVQVSPGASIGAL